MAKNLWKNMKKGLCGTMAVMLCVGTMGTLTVTAAPTNTFEDVEGKNGTLEIGNIVLNTTGLPISIPTGVKRMNFQIPSSFWDSVGGINGVMEFNESGKPITFLQTDEYGNATAIVYEYDGLGRLVSSISSSGEVITLCYNMNNQVESVRAGEDSYNYQYDEKGNVISKTGNADKRNFDGDDAWSYVYDEFGRMIEKKEIDDIHDINSLINSNVTEFYYVYNADGSYVRMCPEGIQDCYYDAEDKMLREECWPFSTTVTYNAQGLLSSTCRTGDGPLGTMKLSYTYGYDELGRIVSVNVFKDSNSKFIGKGAAYYTFEY